MSLHLCAGNESFTAGSYQGGEERPIIDGGCMARTVPEQQHMNSHQEDDKRMKGTVSAEY